MDALFDLPESLSPKLAWLRRHDLTTCRQENGRWTCMLTDEMLGRGEDEEEAIVDFCVKTGMKHYSQ